MADAGEHVGRNEGQTWVTIRNEVYYLIGDGTILPTIKSQVPPDLQ
jgi:hypothetical protein